MTSRKATHDELLDDYSRLAASRDRATTKHELGLPK